MRLPQISVVIPNYEGEKFIKKCLESVTEEQADLYEVVVVDDASTDKAVPLIKRIVKRKRNVRLVELPENKGTVNAVNVGVSKSKGRYIFVLGNDTELKPGWSKEILAFFKTYKKAAVAQAKILKMNTNRFDYVGDYINPLGFLVERARSAIDRGQFNTIAKVFSVKGGAMIIRKDIFKKLGGFDSDYRFGWEEPDFTWRCWLAGFEVYFLPSITVYHWYGTKLKPESYYIKSQIFFHGCKGQISTMIKNPELPYALYLIPLSFVCWSVLAVGFTMIGKFKQGAGLTKGIAWSLLFFIKNVWKRLHVQRLRKVSDAYIFTVVGEKRSLWYYLGKAISYLQGKPF